VFGAKREAVYSFFFSTVVECSVFVLTVPGAAVLPSGFIVGGVVCFVSELSVVRSVVLVTGGGVLLGVTTVVAGGVC
jgi:hypothetical protein